MSDQCVDYIEPSADGSLQSHLNLCLGRCSAMTSTMTTSSTLAKTFPPPPPTPALLPASAVSAPLRTMVFLKPKASLNRLLVKQESTTPYSDATETKPKDKKGKIKRPMNPFMVFAHKERKKINAQSPGCRNDLVSKQLGMRWRELGQEEKAPFIQEAERLRLLHIMENPEYKYEPKKRVKKVSAKLLKEQTPETVPCPISKKIKTEPQSQETEYKPSIEFDGLSPMMLVNKKRKRQSKAIANQNQISELPTISIPYNTSSPHLYAASSPFSIPEFSTSPSLPTDSQTLGVYQDPNIIEYQMYKDTMYYLKTEPLPSPPPEHQYEQEPGELPQKELQEPRQEEQEQSQWEQQWEQEPSHAKEQKPQELQEGEQRQQEQQEAEQPQEEHAGELLLQEANFELNAWLDNLKTQLQQKQQPSSSSSSPGHQLTYLTPVEVKQEHFQESSGHFQTEEFTTFNTAMEQQMLFQPKAELDDLAFGNELEYSVMKELGMSEVF